MKKILFLILIIFLSFFFLSHNQPQSASALENETNDGIIIHVGNGLK